METFIGKSPIWIFTLIICFFSSLAVAQMVNETDDILKVGDPFDQDPYTLTIGKLDTSTSVGIGHVGNFNQPFSGRLAFSEDLNFSGLCGFEF